MEYIVSRFLCAGLTGFILSQTGSLIQMSTRNILASPSTLGFDGLSILWILIFHSVMIFLNLEFPLSILILFGVPVFILFGWLFSGMITQNKNIDRLILIGLTFNLLVGAVFSLWQFLFLAFNLPFPVELWFGHFRFADSGSLTILLVIETLFIVSWVALKKRLALFSLGQDVAANHNLKASTLYHFIFISISVGTFVVISLFGAFSFLALIFPIIARRFWFRKFDIYGEFFIGAAINGIFLMGIDALCYYLPVFGAEVPVGLIATAVGAVSLILMLWKSDSHLEILAKIRK
jgi:iron complex transport system permease protein